MKVSNLVKIDANQNMPDQIYENIYQDLLKEFSSLD